MFFEKKSRIYIKQAICSEELQLEERSESSAGLPTRKLEAFSICLHSLPKVVKRRVNALKNLQVKCAHIEAKFYEEVHELERKYAALYQPLFDKVSLLSSAGGRLQDSGL